MGSSLNWGPFGGPLYKGAVLYFGPTRDPNVESYPYLSGIGTDVLT